MTPPSPIITATGCSPEHLLSLIADRAPELRAAGITRVCLPGLVDFDLQPGEVGTPSSAEARDTRHVDEDLDPLSDPATFGGALPRFERDWEDSGE